MHETFFKFSHRPFAATPSIEHYYPGEAIEDARTSLARCIERAEGYGLLLGPPGTGKTLLCQVLAEQFRGSLTPVLLSGGRITTRKAMLQAILFELGVRYRRLEEGELRLALIDRLSPGPDRGAGLLLLVDEAHTVSPKLFEELRLLTNIIRQGSARVRLVLAGPASLEERLAHPKLGSFQQRIAARCTLRPLATMETHEYVRAQVAAAGADPDSLWTDDALSAIHRVTDGVPRVINQLCNHALTLAAADSVRSIDGRRIDAAWAELQQLPPLESESRSSSAPGSDFGGEPHSVVEFGSLDDDPLPRTPPGPATFAADTAPVIPLMVSPSLHQTSLGGTAMGDLLNSDATPLADVADWHDVTPTLLRAGSQRHLDAVDDPVMPEDDEPAATQQPVRSIALGETNGGTPAVISMRRNASAFFEPVPIFVDEDPVAGPRVAGPVVADVVYDPDVAIVVQDPAKRPRRSSQPQTSSPKLPEARQDVSAPATAKSYKQLFSRLLRKAT